MVMIICPRCKGKGEIVRIQLLPAIFTLGITALFDLTCPDVCPMCDGKGVVNIDVEKYTKGGTK